jgi:NADP-dependent 3-hydroxy acid dehydrogenase YdfG
MSGDSIFQGKVAVVTGAGSGIGRALANKLAANGASLALVDLHRVHLEETAGQLPVGTRHTLHALDVGNRQDYQQFVQEVIHEHDQVDIVINNAGVLRIHSLHSGTYEDFEQSLDTNLWGVIYGCKEFLPELLKRPEAWLVNVCSPAGLFGVPQYASYNTSKFAVRGLTESLVGELRDTKVAVSCVYPGGVKTNIQKYGTHAADAASTAAKLEERIGRTTPEEAAEQILTGMARKKPRIMVGLDARILDVVARLLPSSYHGLVARYF